MEARFRGGSPLLPVDPSWQWTHLMHLTFRYPIPRHHPLTGGASFVRWLSGWRESGASGPGAPLCRISLWCAEEHASGNAHIHALSAFTLGALSKHCVPRAQAASSNRWRVCPGCDAQVSTSEGPLWRRLKEAWFYHNGIARVYDYDPSYAFGAERYVLKYILDDTRRVLDWGVWTG